MQTRWALGRKAGRQAGRAGAGLFATPTLHSGPATRREAEAREGAICAFDVRCVLVVAVVAMDARGNKQPKAYFDLIFSPLVVAKSSSQ